MADALIRRRAAPESIKIVSWQNGTEDEIAAMLAAAFAGKINLSDYWSVNDERVFHHSAMPATGVSETHAEQDAVWVIMDTGANSGYVFADGTPVHFVVGKKDCFNANGYMNSTNTNAGSWDGCARRTWCNEVLPGSFSEKSRKFFKPFKTVTATEYNSSKTTTSLDYFALFAEKEIFGVRSYGALEEGKTLKQIKYYKTDSNRIKKVRGTNNYWWERSPTYVNNGSFCRVGSTGNGNYLAANSTRGIAPFGCI